MKKWTFLLCMLMSLVCGLLSYYRVPSRYPGCLKELGFHVSVATTRSVHVLNLEIILSCYLYKLSLYRFSHCCLVFRWNFKTFALVQPSRKVVWTQTYPRWGWESLKTFSRRAPAPAVILHQRKSETWKSTKLVSCSVLTCNLTSTTLKAAAG